MNNQTYTIYNSLVKLAAGGAGAQVNTKQPPSYPPMDNTALAQWNPISRTNAIRNELSTAPRFATFAPSAMVPGPGTSMQAPTPKPPVYSTINPATGGTRLLVKGDRPIGPALYSNQIKGDLPITPYSSGKINIDTMRAAEQ